MDISSILSTLTSGDSLGAISQSSGTSVKDVQNVLSAGIPSLLSGALQQSQNGDTAQRFAGALSQHSASDLSNLGSFFSNVDLTDGSKIISHLLGSGKDEAISDISERAGVSKKKTNNILSTVAPMLMSLLGKEAQSSGAQGNTSAVSGLMSSLLGNVDMGSLVTGLLGGTQTGTSSAKPSSGKKDNGILGFITNLFK
ncbi:MAG: DUF937 domain-containing protein [Oscillospiraceae bacterium]|nr:DUF937 domain-containing protein [Oscillospiraceae bacterium]